MKSPKKIIGLSAAILTMLTAATVVHAEAGGRTVPHYDIREIGGTWEEGRYYLPDGTMVTDAFFCDGEFTYYLMMDGTAMKDRLTYHPDGEHIIYFDSEGHEVFSNFTNVKESIAGTPVDDLCFFDTYGYMYVDKLTYDEAGVNLYYANPYGVMERNGWFRYSDNGLGYANSDGSLVVNAYRQDWNGENVWLEANGYAKGSWSYGLGAVYQVRSDVRNYIANSGAGSVSVTQMQTQPQLSAPYAPGAVAQESLDDALAMLNQMRYIAGLGNNVVLNNEYNEMAQAGAFVNAVNNKMSHHPDRPDGMSDELYDLGYEGASSSNLAWASWNSSLGQFVELWMDDSDSSNISALGHRRWILNPTMQATGFGYAVAKDGSSYGSVYAFDNVFEDTEIRGVAWPAREMPLRFFDNNMAWSYSYGEELDKERISVKLTCLNQEKYREWNFSAGSSDGFFNVNNVGYGQTGCVIFKPDGVGINAGDQYLVNISQDSETLATYMVSFF